MSGGQAIAGDAAQRAACANCGVEPIGRYCHGCGQAVHVHRTAGAVLHDLAHGVLHFEGKAWRTLALLAIRPGALTRRYIGGERARFMSPVTLFLFSVFLLFAAGSLGGGEMRVIGLDESRARTAIAADRSRLEARIERLKLLRTSARENKDWEEARSAGRAISQLRREVLRLDRAAALVEQTRERRGAGGSVPAELRTNIPIVDKTVAAALADPKLAAYKVKTSAYKYSWALIPISLPFVWLLFAFRRGVGLYDHAVFVTYSLSAMMLLAAALMLLGTAGVASGWLLSAALLLPPLHLFAQVRGGYSLGWFGALWRTLALLAVAWATMLLFVLLILYIGLG